MRIDRRRTGGVTLGRATQLRCLVIAAIAAALTLGMVVHLRNFATRFGFSDVRTEGGVAPRCEPAAALVSNPVPYETNAKGAPPAAGMTNSAKGGEVSRTRTAVPFSEVRADLKEQEACMSRSGFEFIMFHPPESAKNGSAAGIWSLMTTLSWTAMPSGFPGRCDWVFGTRASVYGKASGLTAWADIKRVPRTIFVRSDLVQTWFLKVLPCLVETFVLITGDADMTIPRQVDYRFPKPMHPSTWAAILRDQRILHIFSENLDEAYPSRVTPIPIGVNTHELNAENGDAFMQFVVRQSNITDRPLKVLQCDRLGYNGVIDRHGPQWAARRIVLDKCTTVWKDFCVSNTRAGAGQQFHSLLRSFSFVLCVHGGGVDPNPKAWETLMAGSIPIIEHFGGDSLYYDLPVVFVDSWATDSIDAKKLALWRQILRPHFEQPELRARVIDKLMSAHWWAKVQTVLNAFDQQVARNKAIASGLSDASPTVPLVNAAAAAVPEVQRIAIEWSDSHPSATRLWK